MASTSSTQVPAALSAFYSRAMLRRAVPLWVHTRWAQVRDIPKGNSDSIKFRKYASLTAATTPLSEGVTPSGSQLSVTDITATIEQYGDFITLTDRLMITTLDPILTETAELLGEQMVDTIDQITRDVLAATTTIQYAGAATTNGTVTSTMKLNQAEIKEAVRTLKQNNARRVTKMVNPDNGYATTPVDAAFVAIVHPNTTFDLQSDSAFVPIEKYANKAAVMEGEVGKMGEVRFIETTNAKVYTAAGDSSIDVYGTIILAQDAYGISRISGEAAKNIIKPRGSAGTADPLDQRATSGWIITFVAKILQQSFMINIRHAVS